MRKPEKIFYQLAPHLESLYDHTIRCLTHPTEGLTYNRYRAIGFLKPYKKQKYKKADMIATQLAKIMKTMLVKRIDSSFYAFRQSIRRFCEATDAMVTMFDKDRVFIAPNLPVSDMINDGREDELLDLVTSLMDTDPTIDICTADDFEPGFLEGLVRDQRILNAALQGLERPRRRRPQTRYVRTVHSNPTVRRRQPRERSWSFFRKVKKPPST